jgi:hypothetical protein
VRQSEAGAEAEYRPVRTWEEAAAAATAAATAAAAAALPPPLTALLDTAALSFLEGGNPAVASSSMRLRQPAKLHAALHH